MAWVGDEQVPVPVLQFADVLCVPVVLFACGVVASRELNLGNNQLSGSIPASISNLTALQYVCLQMRL